MVFFFLSHFTFNILVAENINSFTTLRGMILRLLMSSLSMLINSKDIGGFKQNNGLDLCSEAISSLIKFERERGNVVQDDHVIRLKKLSIRPMQNFK